MSGFDKARRRAARKGEKRKPKSQNQAQIVRPMSQEFPNERLISTPTGFEKMSDVLTELVEPWWDDCPDDAARQTLLTFGVVAWNLSLFPEPKRFEELQLIIGRFAEDLAGASKEMVKLLMLRKDKLFPELRRRMLDFELLKLSSGDFHINVKSTLD